VIAEYRSAAVSESAVSSSSARDIPTLVMIGLWDRNCGVDIARDLAERLPQGQLHLFTRSAHLPHDEEPAEYVQAIHPFLYCP
jgi:proline iminopeptidase